MLKKVLCTSLLCVAASSVCTISYASSTNTINPKRAYTNVIDISEAAPVYDGFYIEIYNEPEANNDILLAEAPAVEQPVEETAKSIGLTEAEIDLLALLAMAEAEGEPEHGQRLVIDTVLNRVDSGEFADTIHGVIYQKGQFSSMFDGRIEQCYVTDSLRQLVIEEAQNRTNYDCLWFRTSRYSSYGEPLFKVGNHYFSK